uniref:probable C-terminal domain small phosphatase n=1 Tax=Erigeron canadensis TaxID=72917 RepID=UPI001CB8E674|nr:probable C-terminal domain small phosphatase [Erigeron canadensis]
MSLKPLNLYKTLPTTKAGNAVVRRYLLPPLECPYQKTVVLDLDLTLVNTVIAPKGSDRSAIRHDIVFQSDDPPYDDIYVLKRPFVDEFLRRLNKIGFEVVVFTAGTKAYASRVLDFLDPSRSLINHRLYRDSCTPISICGGAAYMKNLFHLGRDLRMVVVVDDDPISYCLNPSRAIPIKPFLRYADDRQDDELMNLMGYFLENRYDVCFEKFNSTKNYRNST